MSQQQDLLVKFNYHRDASGIMNRTFSFCAGMDLDKLVIAAIGSSSQAVSPSTTLSKSETGAEEQITDTGSESSSRLGKIRLADTKSCSHERTYALISS